MENIRGAREKGSPQRGGQDANSTKPGLFSPHHTESASGEASQALSGLWNHHSLSPWGKYEDHVTDQRKEGGGKGSSPPFSPSMIYIIIGAAKTLPFRRGPKPLSAYWRLFIHISWLAMIAKSCWPPCLQPRTPKSGWIEISSGTERQDTSQHKDPNRVNLPIYPTQLRL